MTADRIVGWLVRTLLSERERWVVWLAVFFACGIGIYFGLPFEPRSEVATYLAVIALIALVIGRLRPAALPACAIVAVLAAGFALAQWRSANVQAPVIGQRAGPVAIEGIVARVEPRQSGVRAIFHDLRIAGLPAAATPERIRLAVRTAGQDRLVAGSRVRLRAVLLPPPGPVAPGAFDFQRLAYFARIGGVGFVVSEPQIVTPGRSGGFSVWLEALRQRVTQRILEALPGERGGVAAALLTGERGRIPEARMTEFRDAGLAHLLAISGLHVGMVMLILAAAFQLLVAAIPALCLRFDPKKLAAVGALIGGLAYVLLSGATVPTVRAFVMFAAAMAGLMIDREGLSLRLVALAAFAILAMAPESLLSASFQMSFGAVVALIAAYEAWQHRRSINARRDVRPSGRVVRAVAGTGFTTIVATAATAPFAAYHFSRIAYYSLAANLVAVPVTTFWILPFGLVSLLAMPFGLEAYPLAAMGAGIGIVLRIANAVASWPGAVGLVPAFGTTALILVVSGGLWLIIWRTPWRLAGAALIAAGIVSAGLSQPPDLLVSPDGRLVALRDSEGRLSLSSLRRNRFAGEIWLRRAGQAEAGSWDFESRDSGSVSLRCDALGCLYRTRGQAVALVHDLAALSEDCHVARLVIMTEYLRVHCPSARHVVDRFELWRNGSHAVWLNPDGIRVVSARVHRGERPWVLDPYRLDRRASQMGPGGWSADRDSQ